MNRSLQMFLKKTRDTDRYMQLSNLFDLIYQERLKEVNFYHIYGVKTRNILAEPRRSDIN